MLTSPDPLQPGLASQSAIERNEREAFEQAAHAYFVQRFAAGKIDPGLIGDGTLEALCWRREDGAYGVYMLNAAWWAWCAARGLPQPGV